MPQYLSTDPNAGMDEQPKARLMASHDVAEGPRYISTDPDAGANESDVDAPSMWDTAVQAVMSTTGVGVPGGQLGELIGRAATKGALPSTGANIGGMLAGPVGSGLGATAGSALSSAISQAESGRLPTFQDLVSGTNKALGRGATAATLDYAGGKAMNAVTKGGRALMGRALNPNPSLLKQFGGSGARDAMAQAAIDEGIVAGTRGAAEAGEQAIARSAEEARGLLAASPAAKANTRVKPQHIAGGLDELRADVATRPTGNRAKASIDAFERDFMASHPTSKTLDELLTLKQSAAREGSAAYRATNADAALDAEANAAIANRARNTLESAAPETRPANARTQARMALTRALEDERTRNHALTLGLATAAGAGTGFMTGDPLKGIGAAALPVAMRDPRLLSMAGIALGRTGASPFTRGAVRAAGNVTAPPSADLLRAALMDAMRDTPAEPNQ